MKKYFFFSLFFIFCLLIIVAGSLGSTFGQWPTMPVITITSDGRVEPSSAPILQNGKTYVFTNDITGYHIEVLCSNITIDGAGHSLIGTANMWCEGSGITITANKVTVKNLKISLYFGGGGIYVNGSSNTITEDNIAGNGGSVLISGDYNTVTMNYNLADGIDLSAIFNPASSCKDNNITYNGGSPFKIMIEPSATYNSIVGNNLYLLNLYGNYNTIYLNNFYRNYSSGIFLSTPPTQGNALDNGTVGNYWGSEFNGTDADHDGIADSPFYIGENVVDRYPLMAPFNIPAVPEPTPTFSPSPATSSAPISPSATVTATPTSPVSASPDTPLPSLSAEPTQPSPSSSLQSPTGSPLPNQNSTLLADYVVIAVAVVVAASTVAALLIRKRR